MSIRAKILQLYKEAEDMIADSNQPNPEPSAPYIAQWSRKTPSHIRAKFHEILSLSNEVEVSSKEEFLSLWKPRRFNIETLVEQNASDGFLLIAVIRNLVLMLEDSTLANDPEWVNFTDKFGPLLMSN